MSIRKIGNKTLVKDLQIGDVAKSQGDDQVMQSRLTVTAFRDTTHFRFIELTGYLLYPNDKTEKYTTIIQRRLNSKFYK